jgi:glycerophosphoryl diester phosphodiesterase
MDKVNTRIVLVQYVDGWSDGFDSTSDLQKLPKNYSGSVWTNRIDVIGPALRR